MSEETETGVNDAQKKAATARVISDYAQEAADKARVMADFLQKNADSRQGRLDSMREEDHKEDATSMEQLDLFDDMEQMGAFDMDLSGILDNYTLKPKPTRIARRKAMNEAHDEFEKENKGFYIALGKQKKAHAAMVKANKAFFGIKD